MLVCLRRPLVSARVLRHVAIRKRFEGSSRRFASVFALLLDGINAAGDLSAELQRARAICNETVGYAPIVARVSVRDLGSRNLNDQDLTPPFVTRSVSPLQRKSVISSRPFAGDSTDPTKTSVRGFFMIKSGKIFPFSTAY